jgi:large subunit ribosomal protein L10e
MVKLRAASAYRKFKIPYTRKSKYKSKNYVKVAQSSVITQYTSGNLSHKFGKKILVLSTRNIQLRENAIESARVVANKYLTDNIGDQNFRLQVVPYPHHVLREHKLATGAGADRFSSGMQKSFGKPAGFAARVLAGSRIFEIHLENDNVENGKVAADKISKKLGINTRSVVL